MTRPFRRPFLRRTLPVRITATTITVATLAAAVSVALVACAHEESGGEAIGYSHSAIDAPQERADAGPAANDPQLPAGWRQSFAEVGSLGASRGHGTGKWPTTVYADETAAKALRQGDEAAAGATLVAVHPSKTGELLFVMQKSAEADGGAPGRWQYRVRDAARVTADPPACDQCHALAPHDHLYIISADGGR